MTNPPQCYVEVSFPNGPRRVPASFARVSLEDVIRSDFRHVAKLEPDPMDGWTFLEVASVRGSGWVAIEDR